MSAKVFIDSNIMIYAYDIDSGDKHTIAASLVKGLWQENTGLLSTQVLQEFYVNVTRKIPKPLPLAIARGVIYNYLAWQVELIRPEMIIVASEIQERNQLSFWDALIVAAAIEGGATQIATEDLTHGQLVEGIELVNPFVQ